MLTRISSNVLRHSIVAIFLLPNSEANAETEDHCSRTQRNWVETEICADQDLKKLDEALNHAYTLARQSVTDTSALQITQLKWRNRVRDRCKSTECLTHAYQEQLVKLSELFISTVHPSESFLSQAEAKEICTALATQADNGILSSLAIPGNDQWQLGKRTTKFDWSISDKEKEKLEAWDSSYNEPSTVYRLRLTAKGDPERFAIISEKGSYPSYQAFNISYLLGLRGSDIGIDHVSDPQDKIMWAHRGNGDYPIFYRNRYFIITANFSNLNRIKMISWTKPDGRQRPLCLLSANNTKLKILSAKNQNLCSEITNGHLRPLKWKPIMKNLPLNPDSQDYRNEFVKRYGDYADDVSLLSIDIDGSGKKKNIGRFDYESGAGCGSTRIWLSSLSKDLGTIENNTLNIQLGKLRNGAKDFYKTGNHYYIAATTSDADSGLVEIRNGQLDEVCRFKQQTKTEISQIFRIEP